MLMSLLTFVFSKLRSSRTLTKNRRKNTNEKNLVASTFQSQLRSSVYNSKVFIPKGEEKYKKKIMNVCSFIYVTMGLL